MANTHRKLTETEILLLQAASNRCDDWGRISVSDNFDASKVYGCRFAGEVKIGANNGLATTPQLEKKEPLLYNVSLRDCTLGDNAFVCNIGGEIRGYDIGDNVYIENCSRIICTGTSSFGNGTEVCVLNEGGGREVPIFDGMSAQLAYLMTMRRDRKNLIGRLSQIIGEHNSNIPRRGKIGSNVAITDAGTITDVNIGAHSIINGAAALINGTILSSCEDPSYVGCGVMAKDFIISEGASVNNGADITRCFIGQRVIADHSLTAIDCLMFANCDFAAGELCSVFAGPYTVSHHKSSLLIAGYFLFFNAGSGSNQSNHLFKTGPVHQGIHERGCKFASNAYVMLPAREGAFTVVLGRHTKHHDTSAMPYSYLLDTDGDSYLMPGANLRSFGTKRDISKWPARDKRKGRKRDRINFDEYNPYIGSKLVEALSVTEAMLSKENTDTHVYNRVRIKTAMLKKGKELYSLALDALTGHILSTGRAEYNESGQEWIDAAGMFAPRSEFENLIEDIENGTLNGLCDIEERFDLMYESYPQWSYAWAYRHLSSWVGHPATSEEIARAVEKGEQARQTLERMRTEDSLRDNSKVMMTSYGVDAVSPQQIEDDFNAVRKL